MSRINKIKSIIIMLLISVLMFAGAQFAVKADTLSVSAASQRVFVMSDTIEARMSTPTGLRFRVYLDEQVKAEVQAAGEFGFIIAPAVNFEHATSEDYLADGAMVDKAVIKVNAKNITKVAEDDEDYIEGQTRYFVNAVLYNIKEQNWYLDFSAVAYYKTGDSVTYTTNENLPKANIGELIEKEFFNPNGTAETRTILFEEFNYGATEPKTVSVGVVAPYTIPAHAIPVKNSNIVFALTLPDNAYSYKLTEDVVINNQNIQQGDNIVSAFDTLFMQEFNGVLDGQGYVFNINIHTSNRPTTGVFCKTLNGTLKNLNLVVRADTWCSGNTEYGSIIHSLNGTIENCAFTAYTTRYGSTNWTLHWAMFNNTTANAVVKNSIFDNRADMIEKFVYNQEAGGSFQNVLIVNDASWTGTDLASVQTTGSIDGLYLFQGVNNLMAGQVAYAYNGSSIVSDSRVINLKETLGYELTMGDVVVRAGNGAQVDGEFSDSESIVRSALVVCKGQAKNVKITLDKSELALTEKTWGAMIGATVTRNGKTVDQELLNWSSSNQDVVTVVNGVVTAVGVGNATVTVSYYGVSASCEVVVEEHFEVITTASEFITAIRTQTNVMLGADIVINNLNASTDAQTSVNAHITQNSNGGSLFAYNGILNGNGYTLTINVGSTSRPNGILFWELNGTIKNTNVVIRSDNWGSDIKQHNGSMVGTLNGTIENCTLTTWHTRFGSSTLTFSPIQKATATAVVRNFVVYNYGPVNTGSLIHIIEAEDKGATIENVAIVHNAPITSAQINTIAISDNMSNVYMFDSLNDLIEGNPSYEYNGSAFVASNNDINVKDVFGFDLVLSNANVLYIAYNEGQFGMDEAQTVVAPTMYSRAISSIVSIQLDNTELKLYENSGATKINATVTKGGAVVQNPYIVWSSSDEDIVTVENGVLTLVGGFGKSTISATYYGKTVSCEVSVEEFFIVVNTAEEFVSLIQSNGSAKIKLGADIVVNNKFSSTNPNSAFNSVIRTTFNGKICGDGYTLTLNAGTTSRPSGILFHTLNGTICDLNVVISSNNWGSGKYEAFGSLVDTLNGTIENCLITLYHNKFDSPSNLQFAPINTLGDTAVVKNSVFYGAKYLSVPFVRYYNPLATIENVGVIYDVEWNASNTAWSGIDGNINGLYLFDTVADAVNGNVAYQYSQEEQKLVASNAKIDFENTFGYEATLTDAEIIYIDYNSGNFGADQDVNIKIIDFITEADKEGVVIEIEQEILNLTDRTQPTQLNVTATRHGQDIKPDLLAWSSSDESVVTVQNGLITVVGLGTATVSVTYYGMHDSCEIEVVEQWYDVDNADRFVLLVKNDINARIRLTSDITIKNKVITDGGNPNIGVAIAGEFNGIIDGQGHTINIVMAEAGRVSTTLFSTLNGTIKNTTFNVSRYDWADDNARYPALISTVNGTFEDCIVNMHVIRFGKQTWNYLWSFFDSTGENAVIRNVVLSDLTNELACLLVRTPHASSTIQNVMIIRASGLAIGHCNNMQVTSNMSNVYAFNGVSQLALSKPSFVYDASTGKFVASTASIDIAKILGYDINFENIAFYKSAGDSSSPTGYSQTEVVLVAPTIVNKEEANTVEVSLDKKILNLHENSSATQLNVTITKNGQQVEPAMLLWSTSEGSVVTVSNTGVVTPTGVGSVAVSVTYYGITATCRIVVEEYYQEVTTAAQFYTAIKSNANAKIKLGADIVINHNNSSAADKITSFTGSEVLSTFNGIIDGQGYTLTINESQTSRPNGVLFTTFNGTLKNLNIIMSANNWGSGNSEERGALIGTLGGTIENSSVTLYMKKFGSSSNLKYAVIYKATESAVIKNSVFYNLEGVTFKFVRKTTETTVIENVAIVDAVAWTDSTIATVSTVGNVSGLYLFNNIADVVNGTPKYKFDGTQIVATTETIDFENVFGYEIASAQANVLYIPNVSSVYGPDEVKTLTVLKMVSKCTTSGHVYSPWTSNGDGTHTKVCINDPSHTITQVCDTTPATCAEKEYCSLCGQTFGEVLGHKYGDWISNGDGTHSQICSDDNTHVITESCIDGDVKMPFTCEQCSYKTNLFPGALTFNTLVCFNGQYVTEVSSSTNAFNFNNEIISSNVYGIYLDEQGTQAIDASSAQLVQGDNIFYVFETVEGGRLIYQVNIYRQAMKTVTFMVDGQEYYTVQAQVGDIITDIPDDPIKLGYAFTGWDYDFTKPIQDDVVIHAKFKGVTTVSYTVKYYFESKINAGAVLDSSRTQTLKGTIGETVTVTPGVVSNFALNTDRSILSGEVELDGSLVLEVYYFSTQIASNAMFASTDIDLVSYGNSAYKIVIPENAGKYVQFAATELQALFFRATGVTLDIITEREGMTTDGYYLSVGDTILRKEAGTVPPMTGELNPFYIYQSDVQIYGEEGAFAVQRYNNSVIMIGIDDYGTVFAAYEFLEKQFSYRYFAADTIYIDEVTNEKLIDINWSYTPYAMRNHATDRMSNDLASLRYRMIPRKDGMYAPHSWMHVLPYEDYGTDHPEWFNDIGNGLCLTNEEMAKEYARRVLELFDSEGNYAVHVAGQMDLWSSHCGCEACTASDNLYTDAGTNAIFINRVCNEIDRLLVEQGRPNFRYRIIMLAYYQFEQPPTVNTVKMFYNGNNSYNSSLGYGTEIVKGPDGNRLTLHKNAGVNLCLYRFADAAAPLTDETGNARSNAIVQAWKEFLRPNNNVLEIYIYRGYFPILYLAFPIDMMSLKNWIVSAKEYGSIQNTWSIPSMMQFEAMRAYVHSQLCYDITLSTEDLIEEFIYAYYGDAAPYVLEFYTEITSYAYQQGFTFHTDTSTATHLIQNAANWPEDMLADWVKTFDKAYEAIENSNLSDAEKEVMEYRLDLESLWPRYWLFKYYGNTHYTQEEYAKQYEEIVKDCIRAGYDESTVVPQLTEDHNRKTISWSTNEWTVGTISTSTGKFTASTSYGNGAVTKNFYSVADGYATKYMEGATAKYKIYYYDANYNYLSCTGDLSGGHNQNYAHSGAVYFKIMIKPKSALTRVTLENLNTYYTQLIVYLEKL